MKISLSRWIDAYLLEIPDRIRSVGILTILRLEYVLGEAGDRGNRVTRMLALAVHVQAWITQVGIAANLAKKVTGLIWILSIPSCSILLMYLLFIATSSGQYTLDHAYKSNLFFIL